MIKIKFIRVDENDNVIMTTDEFQALINEVYETGLKEGYEKPYLTVTTTPDVKTVPLYLKNNLTGEPI